MVTQLALAALLLAAQPESQPLSGPNIPESRLKSLVQTGMTRGFVRIEGRPEIAATSLLDLDDETKQSIRTVEQDRDSSIVFFLVDHLDELRTMTDANASGNTEQARGIMHDWWSEFDENRSTLPLLDTLATVLTPGELEDVTRYAQEYMAAWIDSAARNGETPEDTSNRLMLQLFQEEIARAYEASLRQTQQALQGIYDAVEPTPEQREGIRTIVIEHVKRTRLNAEPADRRLAMRKIYDLLDADRQARLFDYAMRIVVPDE